MSHIHFTLHDREIIAKYDDTGQSFTAIGQVLGKDRTAISREIETNSHPDGNYYPAYAHTLATARRSEANRCVNKIECHSALRRDVLEALTSDEKWSPDLIAHQLQTEHPDDPSRRVCAGTIYAFIRDDTAAGGSLHTQLDYGKRGYRTRKKGPETRGQIKNRVLIDERPQEANDRLRPGDWESDTVAGKAHKSYLATHAERTSQYVVIEPMADKRATTFNASSVAAFRRHDRRGRVLPRLTLTADNGKEFAEHEKLAARMGVDVYFARPYHPWERGTNENVNRQIRRWLPKGTDLRIVPLKKIRRVERWLNNRPRKSLGYRTPREVLLGRDQSNRDVP